MNNPKRMWYDGNNTLHVGGEGIAKMLRGKLSKPNMDANAERLADGWNRSVDDKDLLDWMISRGAYVSHSRDGEVCNVWAPSLEEGEGYEPVEGHPQKCYHDPREAIRAAMKFKR